MPKLSTVTSIVIDFFLIAIVLKLVFLLKYHGLKKIRRRVSFGPNLAPTIEKHKMSKGVVSRVGERRRAETQQNLQSHIYMNVRPVKAHVSRLIRIFVKRCMGS